MNHCYKTDNMELNNISYILCNDHLDYTDCATIRL